MIVSVVYILDEIELTFNLLWTAESPNSGEDSLIEGPKSISGDWSALKNAGFKSVDTVLLCPLNPARAYFFCGDHYVLASVTPGASTAVVLMEAVFMPAYLREPECLRKGIDQGRLAVLGQSWLLVRYYRRGNKWIT